MRPMKRLIVLLGFCGSGALLLSQAANTAFHNAPASAQQTKNPYAGQVSAVTAGNAVYRQNCMSCHGADARGVANIPPLTDVSTQKASDGAIFWFITKGNAANGMPSWAKLPEAQRWQVVTYIKTLTTAPSAAIPSVLTAKATGKISTAPAPKPPFTDYRYERPGLTRHITLSDLPAPYASESADAAPKIVARPPGAWPKVPHGFKVTLYATGLNNPRLMRRAPNGDIFLAETAAGNIKIFRGMTPSGKPAQVSVFATGLNTPFGIAFYPAKNPQWLYIANMDSVVRFPYRAGDLKARGPAEHLDALPSGGHHRSRDVQFSPDDKTMFVSVGSQENFDDGDAASGETDRADILSYNPDGSGKRIYASGIRNPVSIIFNPIQGKCGVPPTSAMVSATTSCPTTSPTCSLVASTAGPGTTWATIRIHGSKASAQT